MPLGSGLDFVLCFYDMDAGVPIPAANVVTYSNYLTEVLTVCNFTEYVHQVRLLRQHPYAKRLGSKGC